MGSTNSPGDSHRTGPSACGLVGSIFPASCRSRAEAFAKRLHHRLTSLNDTDSISTNANNITTTSTIKDEEEGISSPDQIVSAAELASLFVNHSELLNANHHDACHCAVNKNHVEKRSNDLESGYTFPSSVNGTTLSDNDASEIHYDFQSPNGDCTKFLDTINTFEGDESLHTSNQIKFDYYKTSTCAKIDSYDLKKFDDTSQPSSSLHVHNKEINELGQTSSISFEETLSNINDSSLDYTLLSNESPQNIIDENSISFNGNNSLALRSSCSENHQQMSSKLCSDSQTTSNNVLPSASNILLLSSNHRVDTESSFLKKNEQIEDLICTSDDSGTDLTDDDNSTYSSIIDIPGPFVIESPSEQLPANTLHHILKNGVNFETDQHFYNKIDESQLHRNISTVSCNRLDNHIELVVNNKTGQEYNIKAQNTEDNDEDERKKEVNEAEIIKDKERIEEKREEEEEVEEKQPQRVRRCSSLKTGKTPPGTPGRKKIVRFADVLGLDLADVRTFLDEIPKVPNSAFSDLVYDQVFSKDSSPNLYDTISSQQSLFRLTSDSLTSNNSSIKPDKMLVSLFQQPGGLVNFLDIVRDRQVCLENVTVQDPITMCIEGTVRVRNLDFHKSVHIRYTLDSWKHFSDLQASYVVNSCDGFSDKFTFRLYCHSLKVGARLELAVRFQCKGAQYWDNNSNSNYCFQCLPTSLPVSYMPIITVHHNCNVHDWSPTFY